MEKEESKKAERLEYGEADFDRKIEEIKKGASEQSRQLAEDFGGFEVQYLNNLPAFFPIPGGHYRDNFSVSERLEEINPGSLSEEFKIAIKRQKQLFEDIDRYLQTLGLSEEEMASMSVVGLRGEKIDLLKKVYIAMRNKGYSHRELTA
ncbi:MAG: hypothetical protein AAB691_02800 [Patescibacteria group bacterium]